MPDDSVLYHLSPTRLHWYKLVQDGTNRIIVCRNGDDWRCLKQPKRTAGSVLTAPA